MDPTVNEVYLMVSDLDRSVSFYDGVLGLPMAERGDRSARFETTSCTLKVEEDFDAETLSKFGLEPPGDRRGDGLIVVVEVEDADDCFERVSDQEVEVVGDPRSVPWGRRMFLVRDPDGYVLEIFHPE